MERLRSEIAREGPITFARFMEVALYEPGLGYYATRSDRGARSGDFLTAPEIHPIFGSALAVQIEEMWERLGRPPRFLVREYGAGSGALAHGVFDALRRTGSALLDSLLYQPVEGERWRVEAVIERLRAAGYGGRLGDASPGETLSGVVVANEFLDALPVHRVVMERGRLRELRVRWRDGWFCYEPAELSDQRLEEPFRRRGVTLAEGQEAEINLAARAWLTEVAHHIRRGYALVIDYGHPAAELYGPRRARGTLLGYRGHAVSDDPFDSIGAQDLTAHLDMTALEDAAREAGLEVLGRTTQARFLLALRLSELLRELGDTTDADVRDYLTARSAARRLLDPAHLGAFAVLVLGRNVAADPPLRGLSGRVERRASQTAPRKKR